MHFILERLPFIRNKRGGFASPQLSQMERVSSAELKARGTYVQTVILPELGPFWPEKALSSAKSDAFHLQSVLSDELVVIHGKRLERSHETTENKRNLYKRRLSRL